MSAYCHNRQCSFTIFESSLTTWPVAGVSFFLSAGFLSTWGVPSYSYFFKFIRNDSTCLLIVRSSPHSIIPCLGNTDAPIGKLDINARDSRVHLRNVRHDRINCWPVHAIRDVHIEEFTICVNAYGQRTIYRHRDVWMPEEVITTEITDNYFNDGKNLKLFNL